MSGAALSVDAVGCEAGVLYSASLFPHAVAKPAPLEDVPIDVSVEAGVDTLRAQATFAIKQTDFGIKPYSGGPAGTVKVADRVTFTIEAVAVGAK